MKKIFFSFLVAAIVTTPQIGMCGSIKSLKPADKSATWPLPYEVSAQRATALRDGASKLAELHKSQGAVHVSDAMNVFGAPDVITDLKKPFTGLSPKEDGFLTGHTAEVSTRLVWFIRKERKQPGINDAWIGAYIKRDTDEIRAVIIN